MFKKSKNILNAPIKDAIIILIILTFRFKVIATVKSNKKS